MSAIGRVVFDTSTLVGAAIRPFSIPDMALLRAIEEGQICACESTLEELQRVLYRPKFDRYLTSQKKLKFLSLIRQNCRIVSLAAFHWSLALPTSRDPKDDVFLALALAAEADHIVSSDDDLLVLNPWHKIPILTPAEFLAW